MTARIRKDDIVKIIAGPLKGTTGKVVEVLPRKSAARVENVGTRTRKVKPSQLRPTGETRDIHAPISLHKLALVTDEKSGATSRVGYKVSATGKTRVARQQKDKEIK